MKIVGLKLACHKVTCGFDIIKHKKSIKFDLSNLKIFNKYRYEKKLKKNKRKLFWKKKFDKL